MMFSQKGGVCNGFEFVNNTSFQPGILSIASASTLGHR